MSLRGLWLVIALLVAGCAKRQPETAFVSWIFVEGPEASGKSLGYDPALPPLKRGSEAVGARRRTAWSARRVVETRRTEWWQALRLPLRPRELPELDWARAREDADRVRQWFVDRGWLEATVGIETEVANLWFTKKDDTRFWRLIFVVDAGDRAEIRSVRTVGSLSLSQELQDALRTCVPSRGSWTSPARREEDVACMHGVFSNASYPFASVAASASGPLTARDLRFDIDPGPSTVVVDVDAGSGDPLRSAVVQRAADAALPAGVPYEGRRLNYLVDQLSYRPEVDEVDVVLTPEGPDGVSVDMLVVPTERIDLSGSFDAALTGALLTLGGRFDWQVRALGGGFGTLSGFHTLDYRLFDGPIFPLDEFLGQLQHGPGSRHHLELEGLFAPLRGVGGYVAGDVRLDTWRGYAQLRGEGEVGLRWRPLPAARFTLLFRGGYHQHFGWPWQQQPFNEVFGTDFGPTGEQFADRYDVMAAGVRFRYDNRAFGDDSEKGVSLFVEALPFGRSLGKAWSRYELDLRWYAAAVPGRLTLITRVQGGVHVIDDTDGNSLISNRFFLGGPGSYRGAGYRRLGPVGAKSTLTSVHIGGDAMAHVSFDARIRLHPSFDLTPFAGVGRTWAAVLDQDNTAVGQSQQGIALRDLQPVVGLAGTIRTAGQRIEGWAGWRPIRDAGLADPLPVVYLGLRLQRELRPR